MPQPATPIRRERLLAFIKPWADCHSQYACRMGDARLPSEYLTDQALEALADRICRDFWWERRTNRRNRELLARRAACAAGQMRSTLERIRDRGGSMSGFQIAELAGEALEDADALEGRS